MSIVKVAKSLNGVRLLLFVSILVNKYVEVIFGIKSEEIVYFNDFWPN